MTAARGRATIEAYGEESMSTTKPLCPATTAETASRQYPGNDPTPGTREPPESRYAGIRSVGRSNPNNADTMAMRRLARRSS